MEVRVLGPLEVVARDRPVDVGTPKERSLLAMLALARGRPLAAEVLIDRLWGPSPPPAAMTTLHGYVARLRRALEPGRRARAASSVLVLRPGGYALDRGALTVDAERLEQLAGDGERALAEGQPEQAWRVLDEARRLWRGTPLADLPDADWAAADVARLQELHLRTQEGRARAGLALGRHAALVSELVQLVDAHPLHEQLREHLMLALYRSGRQAEALAVMRTGRRLLADELGIDPGAALQALEQAILRQDPSLERPAPRAAGSAGLPDRAENRSLLVGRDAELAALRQAAAEALAGRAGLVLVSGEPGIGKTRLVEEVHRCAGAAPVVRGRCVAAEGAPPFWPWTQVLACLPPTEEPADADRDPADAPAEAARFTLAMRMAERLRSASQKTGLVVVLEDAHWADHASLELLRLIPFALDAAPVLLVVTYRPDEASDSLREVVAEFARHHAATRLELAGLPIDAVARLLTDAACPADTETVVAVHDRTGGNPFFIGELVRWAARRGESLARAPLPSGVRDVVRLRVAALPPVAGQVLSVGAVIGREFPLRLVEAALDATDDASLGAVEGALAAGLVSEVADGRFRFTHALVREALLEDMTGARRARVHARVAVALRTTLGGHAPAAALAHHAYAAAHGGVPGTGAADACLRAAREALARTAYEDAEDLASRGLGVCDAGTEPVTAGDLLLTAAEALNRVGRHDEALARALEAACLARRLEDRNRLAEAALAASRGGYGLYWGFTRVGLAAEALALLEEAHAERQTVDGELRVLVTAELACQRALRSQRPAAEHLSVLALDEARALGGRALVRALRARFVALWGPEHAPARLRLVEELLEVSADREAEATGRYLRLVTLLELGEVERFDAELTVLQDTVAGLHLRDHELAVGWLRTVRALLRGRVAEAEAIGQALFTPPPGVTTGTAAVLRESAGTIFGIAAWFRGRTSQMRENAQVLSGAAGNPAWPLIVALALAESGDHDGAAAVLSEHVAEDVSDVPDGVDAVAVLWMAAEVVLLLGDVERARHLRRRLLPGADRLVVFGPASVCHGSGELPVGSLAAVLGDLDEAVERLERAAATNARIGARPYEALARARLAGVLRTRGSRGDHTRAEAQDTAARAIASDLGLPGVAGSLATGLRVTAGATLRQDG
jgi:DNA-binding SARP family transcriptional activator